MSDEEKKPEETTTLAVITNGEAFPLELRLEARGLFLDGLSTRKIAEKLTVHRNTVNKWAHNGHWRELKDELLRAEERRQIARVRKDVAQELSKVRQRMEYLDRLFVNSIAYKQEIEVVDGKEVPTGRLILRTPADLNMSLNSAVNGLFRLTNDRIEFITLVGKLMGNLPAKLDPAHLELVQLPDVVVPALDGGEAHVIDPTNLDPTGGDNDGQPN